jgi:hypothetical protein
VFVYWGDRRWNSPQRFGGIELVKPGDLVKVNKRTISALWHKVGVVLERQRLGTIEEECVRVLVDGRARLLDERALDVMNASR